MTTIEPKKHLTPWHSSDEWRHVYHMVYNTELDCSLRYEALNIMKIWKLRTPYIPAGVEGTIEILDAVLRDEYSMQYGEQNWKEIQTMYSMAIMRFMNMMVDSSRFNTMFHTAQKLHIPSWVVGLRHEVAHSTKLPSLAVLRKAAEFALHWLYEMYWKLESVNMSDLVVNENEFSAEENTYRQYLERFLILYDNIILCMSEYGRISDISILKMKRELLMHVNTFLMNPNTYINEHCFLKSLLFMVIKRINEVVKRWKGSNKCIETYVQSLLNLNFFLNSNILPEENQNSREFVKFWTPLLDHIHVIGGLTSLIKHLMDISCHTKEPEKQVIACTWIDYILKAIAKCKEVQKITETNYANRPSLKRAIIEASAKSPELKSPVAFRPNVLIDPFFTGFEALQYALLNNAGVPNGKYWKILLVLMDKELPPEDISNLDNLQNLINSMETETKSTTEVPDNIKIHTAADLQLVYDNIDNAQNDTDMDTDFIKIVAVSGADDLVIENRDEVMWKKAPDNEEWKTCPLAVLPTFLQGAQSS